MRSLYYLATPIKHVSEEVVELRWNQNMIAVNTLMMAGILVYAPMLHYFNVKRLFHWPVTWDFWQEPSFELLKRCDGGIIILQIDGWLDSIGVMAEVVYAKSQGLQVYSMRDPESAKIELVSQGEVENLILASRLK